MYTIGIISLPLRGSACLLCPGGVSRTAPKPSWGQWNPAVKTARSSIVCKTPIPLLFHFSQSKIGRRSHNVSAASDDFAGLQTYGLLIRPAKMRVELGVRGAADRVKRNPEPPDEAADAAPKEAKHTRSCYATFCTF
jgi:hypothetical protein